MRLTNNEVRRALQMIVNYLTYVKDAKIASARKTLIARLDLEDSEKLNEKWLADEAEFAAAGKAGGGGGE
jgi:hypothetical protein